MNSPDAVNIIDSAQNQPHQTVLEVGEGSGIHQRAPMSTGVCVCVCVCEKVLVGCKNVYSALKLFWRVCMNFSICHSIYNHYSLV